MRCHFPHIATKCVNTPINIPNQHKTKKTLKISTPKFPHHIHKPLRIGSSDRFSSPSRSPIFVSKNLVQEIGFSDGVLPEPTDRLYRGKLVPFRSPKFNCFCREMKTMAMVAHRRSQCYGQSKPRLFGRFGSCRSFEPGAGILPSPSGLSRVPAFSAE
ncbi:Uncharacterized protein M6B38_237180 [Iris pallida]|uniref:Uncharacterized protein n=1 Tax=Iris pallida TaxID=29817 RepID=A0AAX6DM12_IRIPA|nr:Uncharacterized protein M6B38_237180 [Iris pallida]